MTFCSNVSFAYQYTLSTIDWQFITFDNDFVFPNSEPSINDFYGWSRIGGQVGLGPSMFSLVTSSMLIIILKLYKFWQTVSYTIKHR